MILFERKLLNIIIIGCAILCSCENNSKTIKNEKTAEETALYELNFKNIEAYLSTLEKKFNLVNDTTFLLPNRKIPFLNYRGVLLKGKTPNNDIKLQFVEYHTQNEFEKAAQRFLNSLGDMEKVERNKNLTYIKSPPTFSILNKKSIIVLKYKCETDLSKSIHKEIKDDLIAFFLSEGGNILNIQCGGPLEWNEDIK